MNRKQRRELKKDKHLIKELYSIIIKYLLELFIQPYCLFFSVASLLITEKYFPNLSISKSFSEFFISSFNISHNPL